MKPVCALAFSEVSKTDLKNIVAIEFRPVDIVDSVALYAAEMYSPTRPGFVSKT